MSKSIAKNKTYRKGRKAERELVDLIFENNGAAVPAPASGRATKHVQPDVVAGIYDEYFAFQVKNTKEKIAYIEESDVQNLVIFSRLFGADPIIAVKFPYKGFWVDVPDNLRRTAKGYYAFEFGIHGVPLERIKELIQNEQKQKE